MNTDRFLVDTNIFILLFNDSLAEPLPDGEIVCSVITEMELLSFPDIKPRHSRGSGNPEVLIEVDSRFRGNDGLKKAIRARGLLPLARNLSHTML